MASFLYRMRLFLGMGIPLHKTYLQLMEVSTSVFRYLKSLAITHDKEFRQISK